MKIRNDRRSEYFADINIPDKEGDDVEVVACFKLDPDMLIGEGDSRVCIALDSSVSIKEMFGVGSVGMFSPKPNYIEMVTRSVGKILMQVSSEELMPVFYWALGRKGEGLELAGQFSADEIEHAEIKGPKVEKWGRGTKLLPSLRYICETISQDMNFTMAVIITDGFIEDEDEAIQYCMEIGREIQSGARETLKLVLIGIGNEVNAEQLERFDDMFEGTELEDDVDLFSSGIAASIQDEGEILDILFGELMTEDVIVAPSGRILDEWGNMVANYTDGLPGKIRFTLPKGATYFSLEIQDLIIEQPVTNG